MKTKIFFFVLIALIGCQNSSTKSDTRRPNIIFIMADDHARQAISAYGHPISQLAPTPNIDRIARDGALFLHNFVTNSICGPSRAVILTGKHSHINGFRMNGERFDGNQQTLPKLLQAAGYTTGIVGKWHLHGHPQGFDVWQILNGQGYYYNPQFFLSQPDGSVDTTIIEGYATDIITNQALDFLDKYSEGEKPFFLMLHHKAPHRNWMPALRHINTYDQVTFPVPDSYFDIHENSEGSRDQLQTIYKDMLEGYDLKLSDGPGSSVLWPSPWMENFERMSPEQKKVWDEKYQEKNDKFFEANLQLSDLAIWKYQRYLQEYLSTIKAVDEGVGEVLDYLEANNLDENTIVVYTSDQGFYLGERGWFDKRYMYEPSLSMPLLMKYPNHIKAGTRINDLTQNLDFAQTFLDYAQTDIPEDLQGKSLRPLVENDLNGEKFRDAIYYHFYDFPADHMVNRHDGVRTDRYKLIHYYDKFDSWELYDLEKDPNEEDNLIAKPEFADLKAKMMSKLDSLHQVYHVTDKEFSHTPQDKIDDAYKYFHNARKGGIGYDPIKGIDYRFE